MNYKSSWILYLKHVILYVQKGVEVYIFLGWKAELVSFGNTMRENLCLFAFHMCMVK